jgi:phosphoribosyl 1,2-cyclic phosphodiesterase
MLKHIALASSSAGNCHIISEDGGETYLMIECGIPLKKIQEKIYKLGVSIEQIKGCIVTHNHQDHFKAARDLLPYMPIYSAKETLDTLGIEDPNLVPVEIGKPVKTDAGFTFIAFDVYHNCPKPINFVLKNKMGEYVLFVTDTSQVKLKLPNVRPSLILIEANFDEVELKARFDASMKKVVRNRGYETILKGRQLGDEGGHLSFQAAIRVLEKIQLGLCKYIILTHLSPSNSFDYFAYRVSKAFEHKYEVKQLEANTVEITEIQLESNCGF